MGRSGASGLRFGRRGLVVLLLIVAGCASDDSRSTATTVASEPFGVGVPAGPTNHLYQFGAANPDILAGITGPASDVIDIDGVGVGALEDGEIVILRGEAWRSSDDGSVSELEPDDEVVVSAVMSGFTATETDTLSESTTCEGLSDVIDALVGDDDTNRMAVFVIEGRFSAVEYVEDKGVSADQPTDDLSNIDATVVGVKSGTYASGDSFTIDDTEIGLGEVPLHMHFITDDRSSVGHLRSCEISSGTIDLALAEVFDIRLDFTD